MPFSKGDVSVFCGLALALVTGAVPAAEWTFAPNLAVEQTRTDNLNLAPAGQQHSETITQLKPGLSLSGKGRRLTLESRYNAQDLSYSNDSSVNRTDSQFSLNLNSELIADWLYLDLNGQLSQQLLAPQNGIVLDNLSADNGSRGDVVTTRVSPSIKRRIGKGLDFNLGLTEGRVNYELPSLSDTTSRDLSLSMTKSRSGAGLDWSLSAAESRTERKDGNDFESQSVEGRLGVPVIDDVSVVAYAGRETSKLDTSRKLEDGDYWSLGALWQPSPKFSLELTQGDKDTQAHLELSPNTRSQLSVDFVSRDVGANTGKTWSVNGSHRTRRTVWTLGYTENITSDAVLAITGQEYEVFTINGQTVFIDGVPVPILVNQLGIVDEEFVRAVASASVSYTLGKSQVRLLWSDEQRDYEVTARHSETQSAHLSLNRKFASRTSIEVGYGLVQTEELTAGKTESVISDVSLNRDIGKKAVLKLIWRQADMNQTQTNNSYTENRISASLSIKF